MIGSAAVNNPTLIKTATDRFGSQCIVISVDAKRNSLGFEVYTHGGTNPTGINAIDFAKQMALLGAGELLVNSLNKDGT